MLQRKKYSEKADVYSFGVMLLEVYTGDYPYSEFDIIEVCTRARRSPISGPACRILMLLCTGVSRDIGAGNSAGGKGGFTTKHIARTAATRSVGGRLHCP